MYNAIATRAGYEDPELPSEVISPEYTTKIHQGLKNDGDTQTDSPGLYYQNGNLHVGQAGGMIPKNLPKPVASTPSTVQQQK